MAMWDIHLVERLAEQQGSIGKEEKAHMVFWFHLHAHAIYPGAIAEDGYGGPVCIPFAFALKRGLTRYSIHLLPANPPASQPAYTQVPSYLPRAQCAAVLPVCLPATSLKLHRPSNSPSYDPLPYQPPNHLKSKLAEPVTKLSPISASAASHVHRCVSARGLKVWRSSAAKSGEGLGGWEPAQSAR
jgi:hypothetical protein